MNVRSLAMYHLVRTRPADRAPAVDIIPEPGEVLFMPVGWWHHVRALEVSMTLAFTNFVFPNHFNWEE
jgi:ribosomal protein L16 Arg81 hydroxylase